MKSTALKSLMTRAEEPLAIMFDKKKPSLKKYANARAELRKIYSELALLTLLTEEDKLELNRFTISCILNMFSSERAIFFPGKKEENYSKEEMKSWLAHAEKELKELQAYYRKTASAEDFDYYNLKLDQLGLKAEYYYHCLLDSTETNHQGNTLQLIRTMIVMLEFMASLNDDLLEKNKDQLKRHCSYWLDIFLEKTPESWKKNPLICRCSFLQIKHNVNNLEYDNPPIQIWLKLCSLTQKIVKKWEHPISRDIKDYLNSLSPQDSSELEMKDHDTEMLDNVQPLEMAESSSHLNINSSGTTLSSLELSVVNCLAFARDSLNTVAASPSGLTGEQEISLPESSWSASSSSSSSSIFSADNLTFSGKSPVIDYASIMPMINSGKNSRAKRKKPSTNGGESHIEESSNKRQKKFLDSLKLIEEAATQLRKERQLHKNENLNIQQRLEVATKKITRMEKDHNLLTKQLEEVKESSSEKIESLNEFYSKKISDLELKHNRQLIRKDEELNTTGIALEKLQEDYNEKKEEWRTLAEEYLEQKTLAKKECEDQSKINDNLKSQLTDLQKMYAEMEKQYDNLLRPFNDLTKSVSDLKKENQRLKFISSQKEADEHVISNRTLSTNKVGLFKPVESTLNSTTSFAPIKGINQP